MYVRNNNATERCGPCLLPTRYIRVINYSSTPYKKVEGVPRPTYCVGAPSNKSNAQNHESMSVSRTFSFEFILLRDRMLDFNWGQDKGEHLLGSRRVRSVTD